MLKRIAVAVALLTVGGVTTALVAIAPAGAAQQPIVQAVREQSVDAQGNIKVHEQGTANVSVTNGSVPVTQSGTWNVGLTGTPSVKSGDTATVLAQGADVPIAAGARIILNPSAEDVSGYRDVTFYWTVVGGTTAHLFAALTNDGSPYLFAFDHFVDNPDPNYPSGSRTYDPAPARLAILYSNDSTAEVDLDYTLVARTN